MTHLFPLAAGIVERRGGILIHAAIIARELGIACVNGVSVLVKDVPEGELVTVDGDLGVVTIGSPEFRVRGSTSPESVQVRVYQPELPGTPLNGPASSEVIHPP
ncbi:MAG: phosphoenolpyruvate synthase/pyruvate phosphate dikinase [Planctomycetota bacterium]|jgi:phosphoenolpyruvate synthase/pyruvate phosphate dikinase